MSEIERSNPTAGGDAPVIEAVKTDRVDGDQSRSIGESEGADVVISASNVPAESELPTEEIANSNANVDRKSTEEEAVKVEDGGSAEVIEISTAVQNAETPRPESADEEKANKSKQNVEDNNQIYICKLEAEMEKRTRERDDYRKKLEDIETKLTALQTSCDAIISNGDDNLQGSLEQLRVKLAQTALMYEERNRVVANQENQINALNKQVVSLKEVVSITRDLLQIRNMEVKQLQAEVDNMEKKISEERDRHNVMISKMDAAMRLNADLKKEYETQLSLFQHLREKYDEKIVLLSGGKEALLTVSTSE